MLAGFRRDGSMIDFVAHQIFGTPFTIHVNVVSVVPTFLCLVLVTSCNTATLKQDTGSR